MAKGIYIGVGGVKKVKKIYVGVNGAPRKVKKVFVGVGGVPKLVYSGEPQKASTPAPLSRGRGNLAGAYNNNYALFAGGLLYDSTNVYLLTVDAYNASLVNSVPTPMVYAKAYVVGGNVGDYAIVTGGNVTDNQKETNAWDASLTRVRPTRLTRGGQYMTAGELPNKSHILLAGAYLNSVEIYDSSLVKTNGSNASTRHSKGAGAASVGNYVIFAGSDSGILMTAYDTSLVMTVPPELSELRQDGAGASTSTHAIFTGGYLAKNSADAYDASLVKTTANTLSVGRAYHKGIGFEDYAIFGGGSTNHSGREVNSVDVYDTSLVRTVLTPLDTSKMFHAVSKVGNYVLFAGGQTGSGSTGSYFNNVDAYEF